MCRVSISSFLFRLSYPLISYRLPLATSGAGAHDLNLSHKYEKLVKMDVVLFGDQTADCQSFLKKSSRRKGCPLLSSFLKQAHVALQDEISSSPSSSRQHIPAFSTVSELAERYNAAAYSNLAVESAITCLAQLTHFIG